MAQLIKLYDYISRYESNPFHYPTQYIQLKRENWRKLNDLWEKGPIVSQPESELNEEKNNKFRFNPFSKKNKVKEEVEEQQEKNMQLPKIKKEKKKQIQKKIKIKKKKKKNKNQIYN